MTKSKYVFGAIVATACWLAPVTAEAQGKNDMCRSMSQTLSKWVVNSREAANKHRGLAAEVQLNIAARQQYVGLTNRMTSRANSLLTSELTEREVLADLYGLCMAIAD